MRQTNKAIISASIFLAVSMAGAGSVSAWAQGDDAEQEAVETEAGEGESFADEDSGEAVFNEGAGAAGEAGEAVACPEGETCADDAGLAAPGPVADAEAGSSDAPVLATPGSSGDDGAGGGSSRPGSTPDT